MSKNDHADNNSCSQPNDVGKHQFQDESTECAICLGSLNESESGMKVIELTTCGHRWHLDCLKEQLCQAQPNPAYRLVLNGCRCAKCGSICNHPDLKHLTRSTDALREKVDELLMDQLHLQRRDHNAQENLTPEAALEEARRMYAVYLCSQCQEPYFGGTIACADTIDGEIPPNERFCIACAPNRLHHVDCKHPLQHRGHHVWKCRYCCNIATYVCYGTVHFCSSCHDRNSARVEQVRRYAHLHRKRGNSSSRIEAPVSLTSIPCLGGEDCSFPKPPGSRHHQNGPSSDCEQVYGCAWCKSNPVATSHMFQEPPGSRNFLLNNSGQSGSPVPPVWQRVHQTFSMWHVEESETPLNATSGTNFVSNFNWCAMAQVVPLYQFARHPSQVMIEVSAKYMGRTDCPSIFQMRALLLNRNKKTVSSQSTGQLSAPADYWERASLLLEPASEAHFAVIVVEGKDRNFWSGNFGSKVTDCKVRILCRPEELERVLLPERHVANEPRLMGNVLSAHASPSTNVYVGREVFNEMSRERHQRHRYARPEAEEGDSYCGCKKLLVDGVFPLICLIILTWLYQMRE